MRVMTRPVQKWLSGSTRVYFSEKNVKAFKITSKMLISFKTLTLRSSQVTIRQPTTPAKLYKEPNKVASLIE